MIRFLLWFSISVMATPSASETILAARTIRAQTIIGPLDITLTNHVVPGGISDLDQVIGMESRVALYAGRPIRQGDIGPPALVDRNQIILLIFAAPGVSISTEGRALARGGVGDRIRVMNLSSRSTVFGVVQADGSVQVSN